MHICGACGVIRALREAKCPHCLVPYEGTFTAPFRPDDAYWVCIECTFKCGACKFVVPLNHIDMDGAVICPRCGLEQAFDVSQWRRALDHAQGTGDLWTEQALFRDNELSSLGEYRCSRSLTGLGENQFAIVSSPGQPLCEKCHAPIDVAHDEESLKSGVSTTACACGEKATHEVPNAARRTVRAIIATEHRVDRKAVKVDQNAAAIAVACPSCNAPLEANESSKFMTCSYCHTTSRIPDRTWFRISGKDPQPDPMWVLFHGASEERAVFERRRAEQTRDEERAAKSAARMEEAARKQLAAHEREKAEERARKQRYDEDRAEVEREKIQRERDNESDRKRGIIVALCLAVPVTIGVVWAMSQNKKQKADSTDPLSIAEAACTNKHDGKACDQAGDLTSSSKYGSLKLSRYESACDARYAPGCTHRGQAAEKEKEYDDAASYYERGCKGGDTPACTALDALYSSGKATSKDPSKVALYADKACTAGKLDSCVLAGLAYSKGSGVVRDDARAAGLFKKACDGPNAEACDLLGHAYETAAGVAKNDKEMVRLYQKACDMNASYCFDLGRMYEDARGVGKNEAKAAGLFTQACSAGNESACAAVRKQPDLF
jgi:hypothetical protein